MAEIKVIERASTRQDLTGKRFGKLTVISRDRTGRRTYWKCRCDCGKTSVVRTDALNITRSCGCGLKDAAIRRWKNIKAAGGDGTGFKNIAGQLFGRLLVIRRVPVPSTRKSRLAFWECLCECGALTIASGDALRTGHKTTCGCVKAAKGNSVHGHSSWKTHEMFQIYRGMIRRCYNDSAPGFDLYGGRGIGVCNRWLESFTDFVADVGPRPSPAHSLDRYPDKNGNYEPGNVRWATDKEQTRNKRTNANYTIDGRTQCLQDWANEYGMSYTTVFYRLRRGVPIKEALTKPTWRTRAKTARHLDFLPGDSLIRTGNSS